MKATMTTTPAPASRPLGSRAGQGPRAGGRPSARPAARERLLHRLWREQRLAAGPLPAGDRGPDFRDAILATQDGRLLRGDVELHLHARDWRSHGHHRDPEYVNVILHVAWRGWGEPSRASTAAGARIPTVALEGLLDLPPEVLLLAGHSRKDDPRPCIRHGELDEGSVAAILDREGERRFEGKAAALAGDAAAMGPEQALYRALLDALGYSKNREPFQELAERAPLAMLTGLTAGKAAPRRRRWLEALLFGAAGLLPSQRRLNVEPAPEVLELERLWASCGGPGGAPLPWQLFRVRPENAPPRRVAAAAALVDSFLGTGLVEGLADVLGSRPGPEPAEVRRALTVTQQGYWARHVDFGKDLQKFNPTLLGSSRASDMVVNVVLPFFHAWADERGDARLRERCLELYRGHPPLSQNRIIREMERMLLPEGARRVVTSALRQQGLIGLYKKRCQGLLCQGCGLAG